MDRATMGVLFTTDARVVRPNGLVTVGPDAIVDSHVHSLRRFRATQHLTSGFIVDLSKDRKAAALRANLVALHWWADGHGDADVAVDDTYFVAGSVLSARIVLDAIWRIAEFAIQPSWRRGVGFRELLETFGRARGCGGFRGRMAPQAQMP